MLVFEFKSFFSWVLLFDFIFCVFLLKRFNIFILYCWMLMVLDFILGWIPLKERHTFCHHHQKKLINRFQVTKIRKIYTIIISINVVIIRVLIGVFYTIIFIKHILGKCLHFLRILKKLNLQRSSEKVLKGLKGIPKIKNLIKF